MTDMGKKTADLRLRVLRCGWLSLLVALPPDPLVAQDLRQQVGELAVNDKRQDLRLYHLERDVGALRTKPATYTPSPPSFTQTSKKEAQVSESTTYIVKPGDTLWRVAMNHRLSPGEIMEFNRLSNDRVQVGQKLLIPTKGQISTPPVTMPAPTSSPQTQAVGSHTVVAGDTFSSVARQYRVSQAALQQYNPSVNPNLIVLGTSLRLPPSSSSTDARPIPSKPSQPSPAPQSPPPRTGSVANHTVAKGETLYRIASLYGVRPEHIQQANGLTDPNLLRVGQALVIPGAQSSVIKKKPSPPTPNAPTSPADSPSPASSTLANAAGSNQSVIVAPSPMPQTNHRGVLSYRVDSTDSIESIANTFSTTPQRIRELNRLPSGAKLKAGDEIIVPALSPVSL